MTERVRKKSHVQLCQTWPRKNIYFLASRNSTILKNALQNNQFFINKLSKINWKSNFCSYYINLHIIFVPKITSYLPTLFFQHITETILHNGKFLICDSTHQLDKLGQKFKIALLCSFLNDCSFSSILVQKLLKSDIAFLRYGNIRSY